MHNAVVRIRDQPFTFGTLAQDDAFTTGSAEIASLAADMRNGQDVVVLAPRRYGKTSLVLRAMQEVLADEVLVAYCDLMRTPTKVRLAAALAKTIVDDLLSPVQGLLERAGAVVRGLRVRPTSSSTPTTAASGSRSRRPRPPDIDATIERLLELPGGDRGRARPAHRRSSSTSSRRSSARRDAPEP